jgi:hypothetical protein
MNKLYYPRKQVVLSSTKEFQDPMVWEILKRFFIYELPGGAIGSRLRRPNEPGASTGGPQ